MRNTATETAGRRPAIASFVGAPWTKWISLRKRRDSAASSRSSSASTASRSSRPASPAATSCRDRLGRHRLVGARPPREQDHRAAADPEPRLDPVALGDRVAVADVVDEALERVARARAQHQVVERAPARRRPRVPRLDPAQPVRGLVERGGRAGAR
jgi:hypothetical protein